MSSGCLALALVNVEPRRDEDGVVSSSDSTTTSLVSAIAAG